MLNCATTKRCHGRAAASKDDLGYAVEPLLARSIESEVLASVDTSIRRMRIAKRGIFHAKSSMS